MITTKDFATIYADYAFFEAHSTEAHADVEGYLPFLRRRLKTEAALRWLDFGCGSGNFTSKLLTRLQAPPEHLHLTLVDPDAGYRQEAQAALQRFTANTINAWPTMPTTISQRYDLALANHVLYYVPDLCGVVEQIVQRLKPRGRFLIAMAGRDNTLAHIWESSRPLLGQPLPYHTAENLEQVLARLGYVYHKQRIDYIVRFADSEQNRLHLLRFIFADYFDERYRQQLLRLLEPYQEVGDVVIQSHHEQYQIVPIL